MQQVELRGHRGMHVSLKFNHNRPVQMSSAEVSLYAAGVGEIILWQSCYYKLVKMLLTLCLQKFTAIGRNVIM